MCANVALTSSLYAMDAKAKQNNVIPIASPPGGEAVIKYVSATSREVQTSNVFEVWFLCTELGALGRKPGARPMSPSCGLLVFCRMSSRTLGSLHLVAKS